MKEIEDERIVHEINVSLIARILHHDHKGSWNEASDDEQWNRVFAAVLVRHDRLQRGKDLEEVIDAILEEIQKLF